MIYKSLFFLLLICKWPRPIFWIIKTQSKLPTYSVWRSKFARFEVLLSARSKVKHSCIIVYRVRNDINKVYSGLRCTFALVQTDEYGFSKVFLQLFNCLVTYTNWFARLHRLSSQLLRHPLQIDGLGCISIFPIQPRPLLKRPLSYELNNRSDWS